jgi:hypothetical protein
MTVDEAKAYVNQRIAEIEAANAGAESTQKEKRMKTKHLEHSEIIAAVKAALDVLFEKTTRENPGVSKAMIREYLLEQYPDLDPARVNRCMEQVFKEAEGGYDADEAAHSGNNKRYTLRLCR